MRDGAVRDIRIEASAISPPKNATILIRGRGVSVSVKPFCASGNFDASSAQVAFWVNCVLCGRGLTRDSLFIDEAILFYTLG